MARPFVLACAVLLTSASTRVHAQMSRPAGVMFHYPRWSASGDSVLVVEMSATATRVLVIPVNGARAVVVPTGSVQPHAAEWGPNARLQLLATNASGQDQWYVLDRASGRATAITRDSIVAATADSSVVLFESIHHGESRIFETDRTRLKVRQVTLGHWAEQATLSPDGQRILYEKRNAAHDVANSVVEVIDRRTGASRTIARGTDPSWSPRGDRVLFKLMEESGALWVATVDLATARVSRLAQGVLPQWSPDGRRIVFMANEREGHEHVYVMSADGSGKRCLTCRLR